MEEIIDFEATAPEAVTAEADVSEASPSVENIEAETLPSVENAEPETTPETALGEEATEDDSSDSINALKSEIERLNALLSEKEQEQSKILSELGEFNRLFPNVAVRDVPETVWKKVENGLPLYAAYAIHEREESLMRQRANEVNTRNALFSAGRAGDAQSGEYFSPEEVRTMTQKEVHENYSKIRTSMKYWR